MPPPNHQGQAMCARISRSKCVFIKGGLCSVKAFNPPHTACLLLINEQAKEGKLSQTQFQKTSGTWAHSAGLAFKYALTPFFCLFVVVFFMGLSYLAANTTTDPKADTNVRGKGKAGTGDSLKGRRVMRTERTGSGAPAERQVRNEGVWRLMWLVANIRRDAPLNIPTRRRFVESLASLLRENNNLAGTGRKTVVVKPQLIVNERQVGQLTVIVG